MSSKTTSISDFRGVDNVAPPERLSTGWLRTASNVDVSPAGVVARRPGYSPAFAGELSGGYATTRSGGERLYVVDAGTLKQIHADMTADDLLTGLADAPMYWAEMNGDTYFSNGVGNGRIRPDGSVIPWGWPIPSIPQLTRTSGRMPAGTYSVACTFVLPDGRETGASEVAYITLAEPGGLLISEIPQHQDIRTNIYIAPADSTVMCSAMSTTLNAVTWNASPDALGDELMTLGLEPIPAASTVICAWQGRMWASEFFPNSDVSAIWFSEPLAYHLFNLQSSFLQIPGEVVMLLPHQQGLIIGTRSAIYMWSGEALSILANYGVPRGSPGTVDSESEDCFFWTDRGLCRGLPFENLTAGRLHVDPGSHASAAIVHNDGLKKLVITTRPSGAAFNQRTPSP